MSLYFRNRFIIALLAILALFLTGSSVEARRSCSNNNNLPSYNTAPDSWDLWTTFIAHHFAQRPGTPPPHRNHRHLQQNYNYKVTSDDDMIKLSVSLPGLDSSNIKVSLSTTSEPGQAAPTSTIKISPRDGDQKATATFKATTFTIDSDVDLGTISSTMSNGILEVSATKQKPEVNQIEIEIASPPKPPSPPELEIEGGETLKVEPLKAEPPSPDDSPGMEVFTDEE